MYRGQHSDRTRRPSLLAIAIPLGLLGLYLLARFGWALVSALT